MARPKQDGLRYFSFDVDFFYSDRRIKALRARYGSDGIVFYIYLLTEIYRNGYYARWDEDSVENATADLGLTEGLIEQIMTFLVGRSLLTKSTLANSDTIITSPGIQRRYQSAVKSLKRDIFVDQEIWLLSEEETAAHIKVVHFHDKSGKNPNKSEKNESKSGKNPTKEIKRNETKEIKKTLCKAEASALFEQLWELYPCKRGKGRVSDTAKQKLLKIGLEEMTRAIDRYKSDLDKDKSWRKPQNGSTFFNSGYIDYLDANYHPPQYKNAPGSFNDFPQREYDYDQLEKMLVEN